jgi:hypothetical protein
MRAFTAIGFVVGFGCGALALQSYHQNKPRNISVQMAECDMRADQLYKTSDKNDAILPKYVEQCMVVKGYDFTDLISPESMCGIDLQNAAAGGSLDEPGGYTTEQDPSCYDQK